MPKWFAKLSTRLASWVVEDLLFIVILFSLPHVSRPTTETFLIAHLSGIGIATIVMFTGIGAGVLRFPFFTLIGFGPTEGVSLSLFTQIAGKGSGSIQYIRDKMVDWRVVRAFVPYAFCGVALGIRGWPHYMPILLATCSGVVLGGQIGTRLIKIDCLKKRQRHVFIVMLFLSAMHVLFEFLSKY